VTLRPGGVMLAGSVCKRGEARAVVTHTGVKTRMGRAAVLAIHGSGGGGGGGGGAGGGRWGNAGATNNFDRVLSDIVYALSAAGLLVCFCLFVTLTLWGGGGSGGDDFFTAASFSAVLLVASVPIAMRVVCATTMALGCRALVGLYKLNPVDS
jgi:H+-transporting ATPase